MRVLYIDDDRINLVLFENACEMIGGLQVSTAVSGAEALEIAREQAPQALVIDMHLPDTDGLALLQALRREPVLVNAPAFLCSADDPADLKQAAAQAGFAGCWAKPVDAQSLRRELAGLRLAAAE